MITKRLTLFYWLECVLLLLSLICVSITGCKDNSINSLPSSLFYPIDVGNTWNYNYKSYDSLGVLEFEGILKESFLASRIKEGLLVYEFDSPLNPPSPGAFDYRYYFQNKIDGVHYLISSYEAGYWVNDKLLYKYPCSKNDFSTYGRDSRDTTLVISLNDTVVCEAGTFACIVYKNVAKDIFDSTYTKVVGYDYTYVAYGVGKIKYESYSINNEQQFYKTLEYSLKDYTFINQ